MRDRRRDLERLVHKYRRLHELRLAREQAQLAGLDGFSPEEGALRREAFAELAAEFPGALRELELRRAPDFAAKAEEAQAELRALDDGRAPTRRWLEIVADYHALTREAIAVKRWLSARRERPTDAALLGELRSFLAAYPHRRRELEECDLALLSAWRNPPEGRMQNLIFSELARRFELPPERCRQAVFGALEE